MNAEPPKRVQEKLRSQLMVVPLARTAPTVGALGDTDRRVWGAPFGRAIARQERSSKRFQR